MKYSRFSNRLTGSVHGLKMSGSKKVSSVRPVQRESRRSRAARIFLASALAAWSTLLFGGAASAEGITVSAGKTITGNTTAKYDHYSWQMNQTLDSPEVTFEGSKEGGVEATGGWRSLFLFDNTNAKDAEGSGVDTSNGIHFAATDANIHSGFATVIINADGKALSNTISLKDSKLYGGWGFASLITTSGEISGNTIELSGGSIGSSRNQGMVLFGNVPFTRDTQEYSFTGKAGAAESVNGNTVNAVGTKLISADWGDVMLALASNEASGNTFTLDFQNPDRTGADIETAGLSLISGERRPFSTGSYTSVEILTAVGKADGNTLSLKNGVIAGAYKGAFGIRANEQSGNTLELDNISLDGFFIPGSKDGVVGLSGQTISGNTVSFKNGSISTTGESSVVAIQGAVEMDRETGVAAPESGYSASGNTVIVENSVLKTDGGVYGIAGDLYRQVSYVPRHELFDSAERNTIQVKNSVITNSHFLTEGIMARQASQNNIDLQSVTINGSIGDGALIGIQAENKAEKNTISIIGSLDENGKNKNQLSAFQGIAGIAGSERENAIGNGTGGGYLQPNGGVLSAESNKLTLQYMDIEGGVNGIVGIAAKNARANVISFSDGVMTLNTGGAGLMGIGMRGGYYAYAYYYNSDSYSDSAEGNYIYLKNASVYSYADDQYVSICGIKAHTISGNHGRARMVV